MKSINFYPKTSHLWGSKETSKLLPHDSINFEHLLNQYCVIEEKVDGQSIGIYFEEGLLHLLFRGQYYCSAKNNPPPKELQNCYQWMSSVDNELYMLLAEDKIMYGEWLEYCHTIPYDKLPHYFLEYDILDRISGQFLSTIKRGQLLTNYPIIHSVHTHFEGLVTDTSQLVHILNQHESVYRLQNLPSEGFYLKIENEHSVDKRYKWINQEFFKSVIDSKHWREKKLINNQLVAESSKKTMRI